MSRSNQQHALLIIDMQNDFVLTHGAACVAGASKTIPSIKRAVEFFHLNSWPVFFIIRQHRHDLTDIERFRAKEGRQMLTPESWGSKIVKELTVKVDDYVIIKKRFSAFFCTELDIILRRLHIDSICITGTQYPNCIRATVLDAVSLDYQVTLFIDCCSADSETVAQANITDIKNIGVNCLPFTEWQ